MDSLTSPTHDAQDSCQFGPQMTTVKYLCLDTVHTELVLVHNALIEQELCDLISLVTLNLHNVAELVVVHHRSVAVEVLLDRLQYLLHVELLSDALIKIYSTKFACYPTYYEKRAQRLSPRILQQ